MGTPMRVGIDFGRDHLEVDIPEANWVSLRRLPPSPVLADPAAAVRAALEEPIRFPALRRALTSDDHVAIVVSERLPRPGELLRPVLECVLGSGLSADSVTILCE